MRPLATSDDGNSSVTLGSSYLDEGSDSHFFTILTLRGQPIKTGKFESQSSVSDGQRKKNIPKLAQLRADTSPVRSKKKSQRASEI